MTDFLAHYGVKGMKWGQRRQAKREAKAARKQAKSDFYQNKANDLVQTALKKGDKVLISLNTGGSIPTVVTGKEFMTHLSNGGLMNIKTTDVFATKDEKAGNYVLNEDGPRQFKG